MTDSILQLLTAICALLAAGVSTWNSRKIKDIHVIINSRMDALLESTRQTAERKGGDDERALH